ncbi:MAG: hypothetical protein FJ087_04325 [Deltaproteobacteria bacterium]|nr:hypothetical protein [Deltaproteobacteria bacterium]
MRAAFLDALTERMEREPDLFVLTADTGFHVFDDFRVRFAPRFLNVGIAEATMIGVAAGLALEGRKVVTYGIAPFVTFRCHEQVRDCLCHPRLPVTIVGVGAGLAYGPAGMTHHAIEDVAVMAALPGMTVVCPGDPVETRHAVLGLAGVRGPAYLRLGRSGETPVHAGPLPSFAIGRAVDVADGGDVAILATGTMLATAVDAARLLAARGIEAEVVGFPTVKPLDLDRLDRVAARHRAVATLEEHVASGGFGAAVAVRLAGAGWGGTLRVFAIPDEYATHAGSREHLLAGYGLSAEAVAASLRDIVRGRPLRARPGRPGAGRAGGSGAVRGRAGATRPGGPR